MFSASGGNKSSIRDKLIDAKQKLQSEKIFDAKFIRKLEADLKPDSIRLSNAEEAINLPLELRIPESGARLCMYWYDVFGKYQGMIAFMHNLFYDERKRNYMFWFVHYE